jgi:hypothetical protein
MANHGDDTMDKFLRSAAAELRFMMQRGKLAAIELSSGEAMIVRSDAFQGWLWFRYKVATLGLFCGDDEMDQMQRGIELIAREELRAASARTCGTTAQMRA